MQIALALLLIALWPIPVLVIKKIGTPISDRLRAHKTSGKLREALHGLVLYYVDYFEVSLILFIPHLLLGYALGIVLFPDNDIAHGILILTSFLASLAVWIFIDERRKSKNEDKEKELHIFFSFSAERSFQLLIRRKQAPDALTVSNSDYLMHGPVTSLFSGTERKKWIETIDPRYFDQWYLNDQDNAGYGEYIDEFWQKAASHQGPITIWTSHDDPGDWTGYIALLHKLDRTDNLSVIDVASEPDGDLKSQYVGSQTSTELISLLKTARPVTESELNDRKAEFMTHASQLSHTRIIQDGALVSAPIDFMDEAILSFATNKWQKSALIIGRTMGRGMFKTDPEPCIPVSDWFLTTRLVALVEAGRIEAAGDPYEIRLSEVRLPTKEQSKT